MSSFESQVAIAAAARASGRPVLDAGRGQPDWIATTPRAAFFRLGAFAVEQAARRGSVGDDPFWGSTPPTCGIADRLTTAAGADPSPAADFLVRAIDWAVDELGVDRDEFTAELVRGVLGAGYPSPNRMLRHLELVLERYLLTVTGAPLGSPGDLHVFGTEGGAAAMAYVFRSLLANGIVRPGEKVAVASPIFSPYLQIPVLADFGFEVVELRAAPHAPYRFDEEVLDQLRDPAIKAFLVVNPGNPDSRAIRPERLRQIRDLVDQDRPDLVIVADTVYATFVDGFRGLLAEVPRNVICVHSFSKNVGATGNRLGLVAVHRDTVLDDILAAQDGDARTAAGHRYRSLTSDASRLPFMSRLVADSREVALHNITGLATPDQVQMGLFALAHLMPDGARHAASLRSELGRRRDALLAPLGIPPVGGQDTDYYALVDLRAVAESRHGPAGVRRLTPADPMTAVQRLAAEHGVIVLPGAGFGTPGWDVRVCLAALPAGDLARVGAAIVAVLDDLVGDVVGPAAVG